MLEELNEKFALHLDLELSTDRSCQVHQNDFAGSSHSARTFDVIDRAGNNLLDTTVPGFRLRPESTTKMADYNKDHVDSLNPVKTVPSIQVLDNSTYFCGHTFGEMSLLKKLADKRYHLEGELQYVKKQLCRELFALLLTLIKAAGECHIVVWAHT